MSASNRTITTVLSVLLSLTIIFGAVFVSRPRLTDLLLAYDYVTSQILGDIKSVIHTNSASDEKWKGSGPSEYKKRLMSVDPNVKLRTIKAIEEKSDPQFIPQIIKLLNDNTPIESSPSLESNQISEVAKSALIKLLRDNVVRDPGNIAHYLPLFEAGRKGTLPEKLGVIDILSALREPIAYTFLKDLSENKDNPEIASRASTALGSLTLDSVMSPDYYLVTSRRLEFMYILIACSMIMGIAAFTGLLKGKGMKFAALCVMALVINFGLGLLVYAELNRSTLAPNSVQVALSSGDLMALRSMCYTDYTSYPGDSYFCQKLAQRGGIETVRSLIALPSVEPDDLLYLKTNFKVRAHWIMARIVTLNLGDPSLDKIINSHDPAVNKAIAETLGQLRVQNNEIKSRLKMMTQDKSEEVRKLAEQTLSQMKSRPVWPSM